MIKLFRCPRCKQSMRREVGRNVVRYKSFCSKTGKNVTMKRIKP